MGFQRGASRVGQVKADHIALRMERVALSHWPWRLAASTAVLVALGAVAKRYIDGKYDGGER
jgi:hypothetical protein